MPTETYNAKYEEAIAAKNRNACEYAMAIRNLNELFFDKNVNSMMRNMLIELSCYKPEVFNHCYTVAVEQLDQKAL